MIKLTEVYTYTDLADRHVQTGNLQLAISLLTLANNCTQGILDAYDGDEMIIHTVSLIQRSNLQRILDLLVRLLEAAAIEHQAQGATGNDLHNEALLEEDSTYPRFDDPIIIQLHNKEKELPYSPNEIQEQNLRHHLSQTQKLNDDYLADIRFFSSLHLQMIEEVGRQLDESEDKALKEKLKSTMLRYKQGLIDKESRILKTQPVRAQALQTDFGNIVNNFRLKLSYLAKYERKWNNLVKSARKRRDEGNLKL
ncbi:hypothetical protein BABINDRAFT_176137 [Babjeviella inositovora NRRL Y-12698]|uniref:Uncharacterized protein n=1 Tax=Babjeviella inositovora NRRL Y-12698 TaxID=984486 RepID=A0A1E3QQM0_9ASCO|nr:uncharacterized protein BABINDRAFT_176137 [Babjeviella inositovora NRRL Y-12698]ODQ79983.1 hypothetical protein BABINDRAFT_176137 [Babjeviella inositovora NRRL Y-12698]